ncbi:MAG TPA: hypothetical protein DDZ68_10580 [Parvularcula sp.]|nr:hypothetical protein [Parvularcula sp.]
MLEGELLMKWTSVVCAALVAASPATARDQKKKEPAPAPPPPAVEYELDDPHMAEALGEACLAEPAEVETYDSRDNVMIAKTDAGRAFFHLKGRCTPNVMIFADKIAGEDGGRCIKAGETLVFTSSYGDAVKCDVVSINRWLDDKPIVDD